MIMTEEELNWAGNAYGILTMLSVNPRLSKEQQDQMTNFLDKAPDEVMLYGGLKVMQILIKHKP